MTDFRPDGREHAVSQYLEARNYIDVEIIRLEPRVRDPAGKVRTALEFNDRLGNPQAAYPSVQVAGTSGKGSTAMYLSRILAAAGKRTGLHISPYLQVATEKTWTDGLYASPAEFHAGFRQVKPAAEAYRYRDDCPTSVHGMASLALSYVVFREQRIDWCVMETGVGGRHDLVQGLDRRLAVITDLGLDHTKALGETLPEIAWHKAGIMRGADMAVAVYDPQVWPVFEREAAETGVRLVPVVPDRLARIVETGAGRSAVLKLEKLGPVELDWSEPARGYRLRNVAVAAAAADALAQIGVEIGPEHVCAGLAQPSMPGRLERVQDTPRVVLDGAHNAQKMEAMLKGLPRHRGRLVLVLAATGERHVEEFVSSMAERPEIVVLTKPLLFGKKVVDPRDLARRLAGWAGRTVVCPTPFAAISTALDMAEDEDLVLVTGSLYLVGQARNLWYPWQDVLIQRTSYPAASGR